MTYGDLRAALDSMKAEQLDSPATFWHVHRDSYFLLFGWTFAEFREAVDIFPVDSVAKVRCDDELVPIRCWTIAENETNDALPVGQPYFVVGE